MKIGDIVKHTKLSDISLARKKNDMPLFEIVEIHKDEKKDETKVDVKLHKRASSPFDKFGNIWRGIPSTRLEVVKSSLPTKSKKAKKKTKKKTKKEAS